MQNKTIWKPLTISIILMMVASTIVVGADRVNNTSNIYSGNVSDSRSAVKSISSAGNVNALGYEITWNDEEPELYVHPTYLDFGEMRTGETAWASFYVENTGGGVLEWGADCDMDWIEVYHDYGLLNGGDKYVVEVKIDTTDLEGGESGSIYLASNGGDAEVRVEVKIEGSTPIYHLPIYPPVASFTYVPQSPITIMFDASCSYDPDGTIVEYNWDFGDGVMGSRITYNHTYIVNGTYIVKLTVIDNDYSTDTITYNVTITNVTSYDICDFINDLGLENITFAHLISLVKLFRYGSLDSIPPEHRPNGVIKNLTEDDINAVVAYFHGDVVLGNNYAKKSCGRECIAVSEKLVHNLNTGENFSTIQAAIDDNDTEDGHTITVYSGVYNENVVVNKSVTVIGNGQPVVDANGSGSAITLTADGITLIGFTATNSGREVDAGITVTSSNNIITGNNASNNDHGINFWHSSNNIITGNDVRSNSYNGIYLLGSSNNIITGNNVSNNYWDGICLRYSSNCIITGNTVSNNNYEGIDIRYSSNCIITGNTVSNNNYEGIDIRYSSNCIITGNTVSNSDEGRCFQDSSSSDIKCMINCNYIHLYHSNNCTITGNSVNDNYIELYHSNNCTITGNSVNNSWRYGFHLESSCNNSITGNTASHNDGDGIELFNSNNNTITGNNVCNNDGDGIFFYTSSNNIIIGNDVGHNDDGGIRLISSSNNNTITDNTFVNDGLFLGRSHQNTVEDNIVNGKPLVYLEEVSNYKVEDAGQVILLNCNNVTVENLDLSNTSVGIKLWKTEDSKILNNKVYNNSGYGIHLDGSSNNTITGNNVCNNDDNGILFYSSSNNILTGNNVCNNYYCIRIYSSSSNNTIMGNTLVNDGLSLDDSYQDTVENNTVNGKPLVYLKDVSNYKVEDAGQVILVNCSNITVENLDLSNTSTGIVLLDTEDSTISNNKVCNNNCGICLVSSSNNTISCNNASNNSGDGIYLSGSNNNTITGNHVSNNNDEGICLRSSSNNNTFTGNNVCNNTYAGISFELSNNNTITGNNISSNYKSIDLYSSSNNKIYLNNFINNTDNVHYWSRTNIWNSTEEITYYNGTYTNYLGNYWDDYTGSDKNNDGIGDTPYNIDKDKDYYPLMQRYEKYI